MTTGEIYGSSFYVGDAAGRKGDHSAADIGFAKDVGVKFLLPEEVFWSHPNWLYADRLTIQATKVLTCLEKSVAMFCI